MEVRCRNVQSAYPVADFLPMDRILIQKWVVSPVNNDTDRAVKCGVTAALVKVRTARRGDVSHLLIIRGLEGGDTGLARSHGILRQERGG